jgi:hypothetical protein
LENQLTLSLVTMSKAALVPVLVRAFAVLSIAVAIGSCGADSGLPLLTSTPSVATTLTIAGGNNQTAVTGTAVATPFSVKLVDQRGTAMTGVTVTWAITAGGGSLSATSSLTDVNGVATATYTAGTTAGTATVTATAGSLSPVTFTVTVTSQPASSCTAPTSNTASVACLAQVFLGTLSAAQQTAAVGSFTSANAIRWSNLPCGSACRNGVQFSTLSGIQAFAALAVAQAALSSAGYATFQAIRAADDFLGQTRTGYGGGIYFIAFLGMPSATGTWILQLGGHHYAVNILYKGGTTAESITPHFVGVEPQSFTINGVTYTPLQARKVSMYAMINSLDATQRTAAQLSSTFDDVLLGPGQDGKYPTSQGVLVSSLTPAQQTLVKTAIEAWVKDAPDALSTALLADYESATALASTRIAWSRSTDSTVVGSYIRIDGPRVWIEFVCQSGVVFTNQIHFHTIWRDKTKDYGGSFSF